MEPDQIVTDQTVIGAGPPAVQFRICDFPVEEKAARSDYVIMNGGSVDQLETEAQKMVEWLKGRI